jgi:DNA-binding XRE family transcriptional regulator
VTETASDVELLAFACQRNSTHGLQLGSRDKRKMAVRLYASGTGMDKDGIAKTLSVSLKTINSYLSDTDKQLREQRRDTIKDMWMACHTQDEIATEVGVSQKTINAELEELYNLEDLPKGIKLSALHEEAV